MTATIIKLLQERDYPKSRFMYSFKSNELSYEIRAIEEGIFRLRISSSDTFGESLMSRYNILHESGEIPAESSEKNGAYTVAAAGASVSIDLGDGSMTLGGAKAPVKFTFDGYQGSKYCNKGFTIGISLTDNERLFGLGDESRKNIARRGTVARLDMRNIVSYGPIPYLMSSSGWGLLVNCTYAHTYDLGKSDPDRVVIESHKGFIDLYLFVPASHALTDILDLYTRISGRPLVMPKFAYGFTFVLNEQTNAREMLWDCKMFRREDIPCDVVGLEPQWMEHHYDQSTSKKWDEDRFYTPGWLPDNQSGVDTFFYTLREMGFRFSLWLCQNYDLLWEEERQAGEMAKKFNKEYSYEGASILDPHFACPKYMDGLTNKEEPWFKHLEKFVDNGASAFKLDGAFQTNDHPDRLWAGKYFDDEVHNIYPVIYVKQMQQGFTNHTDGRRAFIYTPCLYAGTQQYAASWAGDTGGGYDTVVAMLNFGLSGHTNVTCDMEVTTKEGIHYGFFAPWCQQLGWRNWHQPWFLREELEDMVRYYGKLRSALFPYIYSMAHKAASSGLPITRALSLMYPDNAEYDYVTNCYMFGDSLLVGVFDMKVTLPEGKWIDYFTGDVYDGGKVIDYKIPEGRGGALMVKAGSVFATMDPVPYLEKADPDKYYVNVYHGADAEFTLVEDDGYTYDYKEGGCAKTRIAIENSADNAFDVVISQRDGSFTGRAKREGDAYKESDPVIKGMGDVTSFEVIIHTGEAKKVTLNGKAVEFTVADGKTTFAVPAELHKTGKLTYSVEL
jgi:alpha-glucosidase (family GH31 glycosyl hydrolase)